jgi:hypothetical protein|tara:strand:+ start:154 stop:399 length:246 start_codon:yes stop_codon:yes gene_type:complete
MKDRLKHLEEENKILFAMLKSACKAENKLLEEIKELEIELSRALDGPENYPSEDTMEQCIAHEKAMDYEAYCKGYDEESIY